MQMPPSYLMPPPEFYAQKMKDLKEKQFTKENGAEGIVKEKTTGELVDEVLKE